MVVCTAGTGDGVKMGLLSSLSVKRRLDRCCLLCVQNIISLSQGTLCSTIILSNSSLVCRLLHASTRLALLSVYIYQDTFANATQAGTEEGLAFPLDGEFSLAMPSVFTGFSTLLLLLDRSSVDVAEPSPLCGSPLCACGNSCLASDSVFLPLAMAALYTRLAEFS